MAPLPRPWADTQTTGPGRPGRPGHQLSLGTDAATVQFQRWAPSQRQLDASPRNYTLGAAGGWAWVCSDSGLRTYFSSQGHFELCRGRWPGPPTCV